MKELICVSIISFFLYQNSFSQENQYPVFEITPSFGITWRSTVMNVLNLRRIYPSHNISYHYEKNMQGFSINPGVNIFFEPARLHFQYVPNLRYDNTYQIWDDSCNLTQLSINPRPVCNYPLIKDKKAFIIDHNFNVFIQIRKDSKDKNSTLGIGYSIINYGQEFYDPFYRIKQDIEFNTINVLMQIPIGDRINLEPKLLYIPGGFPMNSKQKYLSFSFRCFYNIKKIVL